MTQAVPGLLVKNNVPCPCPSAGRTQSILQRKWVTSRDTEPQVQEPGSLNEHVKPC